MDEATSTGKEQEVEIVSASGATARTELVTAISKRIKALIIADERGYGCPSVENIFIEPALLKAVAYLK